MSGVCNKLKDGGILIIYLVGGDKIESVPPNNPHQPHVLIEKCEVIGEGTSTSGQTSVHQKEGNVGEALSVGEALLNEKGIERQDKGEDVNVGRQSHVHIEETFDEELVEREFDGVDLNEFISFDEIYDVGTNFSDDEDDELQEARQKVIKAKR